MWVRSRHSERLSHGAEETKEKLCCMLLRRGRKGLRPGASRELSVCLSHKMIEFAGTASSTKEPATKTFLRSVHLNVYWLRLHRRIRRFSKMFLPKPDVSDYSNAKKKHISRCQHLNLCLTNFCLTEAVFSLKNCRHTEVTNFLVYPKMDAAIFSETSASNYQMK